MTTVGTPHTGSKTADGVIGISSLTGTTGLVGALGTAFGKAIAGADGSPQLQENFLAALKTNSTAGARSFNARYPQGAPSTPCGTGPAVVKAVRYASLGGNMPLTNPLDPSDLVLVATGAFFGAEQNDGLVSQCSNHWGTVLRDNDPWNHRDEVNQCSDCAARWRPIRSPSTVRRPTGSNCRDFERAAVTPVPGGMGRGRVLAVGAAVALAGAALVVGWRQLASPDTLSRQPRAAGPAGRGAIRVVAEAAARPSDAARVRRRCDPSSQTVDRLWTTGSLRATELDGDWGRWTGDSLQPSASLRRRFDQLLSARGEVGLPALRAWIGAQVGADHGSNGAQQVRAVWDRHLQLLQTPFASCVDPSDQSTWQAALSEHTRVRRQQHGVAWAEAFYGDEERRFAAFANERSSTATVADDTAERSLRSPAPGISPEPLQAERIEAFGADAADRVRANDDEWHEWQRRVAAAKSDWAAIAVAPELSDLQRAQAREQLLTQRFAPDEQARAMALVDPATE